MANRIHQRNVINALSISNTSIGEYLDTGEEFKKFPGDAQGPSFPKRTLTPDQMVGDGHAYDKHSKPNYYDPLNKPYSGALTTTIGERIFRMWLGGLATPTVNTTPGTIDYSIAQLSPGSEPMVSNLIRTNTQGGAKFLFGDVFSDDIEITQQGSNEPRLTTTFKNGGHFAELPDTGIDTADIEDQDPYLKFDGKKTTLTFSDGLTSYNFVSQKRQIDVSFSGKQNVTIDQMPGDLPIDAANECEGGYTQNLNIDLQEAQMMVKVYMDSNFQTNEFAAWKANKTLTSVTLTFRTCEKIGATTHHAELEIKFPIGEFNLQEDSQNNKDAFSFMIKAIKGDPVTGSLVMGRIRRVGDLDESV